MALQSCTSNLKLDPSPATQARQTKATEKPLKRLAGVQAKAMTAPALSLCEEILSAPTAPTTPPKALPLLALPTNTLARNLATRPTQSPGSPNQGPLHRATRARQPTRPQSQQKVPSSASNPARPAVPASALANKAQTKGTPLAGPEEKLPVAHDPIQAQPKDQPYTLPESLQSKVLLQVPLNPRATQQLQLFQGAAGHIEAQVMERLGHFQRPLSQPVAYTPGCSLEDVLKYEQRHLAHLLRIAKQGLEEVAYVGRQGLLGGMMPAGAEEHKGEELLTSPQRRSSLEAVQRLVEQRSELTSTATLVEALNNAQSHEQPALQRWIRGYIEWFNDQHTGNLRAEDIQEYSTLANIKPNTPASRDLLRAYLFSLANKVQPGPYGETPLIQALEDSLQTIAPETFEGNPAELIQLSNDLLTRLDASKTTFSPSTYATYRPILYALHQILVLIQRIDPGQWSSTQEDGLYQCYKAQLEAIAESTKYYPFVYQSLVLLQSLQRLESAESLSKENLMRLWRGIKGAAYLTQAILSAKSLSLDVDAFCSGYEELQTAFEPRGVQEKSWYDWLQAMNHASLLSLRNAQEYGVFQQGLQIIKGLRIEHEEDRIALHYGIVSQLRELALAGATEEVRISSIVALDELTKGDWAEDFDVMEGLLESLAEVAVQGQAGREGEAMHAKRVLEALARSLPAEEPSRGRSRNRRNADLTPSQEAIKEWLGRQTLDEKLNALLSPEEAPAPGRVYEKVAQRLGIAMPIARQVAQQWLKDYYQTNFDYVHTLFEEERRPIESAEFRLLLSIKKEELRQERMDDNAQEELQEPVILQKKLVEIPIELTDLFTDRSTRRGEPARKIQRVLLTGKAGTGKTTVSQKLAYTWAQGEWGEEFQAVYVLPVKYLQEKEYDGKGVRKQPRLETAITNICFPNIRVSDEEEYKRLQLRVKVDLEQENTLVILDGLDERTKTTSKALLAQAQKGKHKLLMLSRPYGIEEERKEVDMEIEHVGFSDEQMQQYISSSFPNSEEADSLSSFLKNHTTLLELTHVPVNLSILCALWRDDSKEVQGEVQAGSLPVLYRELTNYIWRRYIGKHSEQKLQNEERDGLFDTLSKIETVAKLGRIRFGYKARKEELLCCKPHS